MTIPRSLLFVQLQNRNKELIIALTVRHMIFPADRVSHRMDRAAAVIGKAYPRQYGTGEPTDVMAEAILEEVRKYDARRIMIHNRFLPVCPHNKAAPSVPSGLP